MKIALVSESPTVTTGFGIQARQLISGMHDLGHEVVVFGMCAYGLPIAGHPYPCRIVPMPRDQREALPLLAGFLAAERPDVVFIHYDLVAMGRFLAATREAGWRGPVLTHFVIDGIPFGRAHLHALREARASITHTVCAADYVRGCGVQNVFAALPLVDPRQFRPLPNRDQLRAQAGLAGKFVVGVFGRNVPRKQQPRVMRAVQMLQQRGEADDVLLYLHCQPTAEDPWLDSWNLPEIADQLGITSRVFFPGPAFRQLDGIAYDPPSAETLHGAPSSMPHFPDGFGYVARLNCCDLVVNPAFAGALELALIEAQRCGVPVAGTNDGASMTEALGEGGLLLPAFDIGFQSSGAPMHLVAPESIADTIHSVQTDADLRSAMVQAGFANANRFTAAPLRAALSRALELV